MKKMKKLAFIIAITGIVGLTSCSKDFICTKTVNGEQRTVTITEDNYVICYDEECETYIYDESAVNPLNKESAKNMVEDEGFTCS
jgi:hypothetical protein